MPALPLPRRARWIGAACALALLMIWTSFILIARTRTRARHWPKPFDTASQHLILSGSVTPRPRPECAA